MDIKILKDLFLTIEWGNPLNRHDQNIHKRIMVDPGLLKCGKVEMESTIDRGNLRKISWDILQEVDPHRGEHLLGRTAHSARNGETIHDRTGKPASENVQGKADFENFTTGSETTEFVNKVRNQVRIRQLYRTFNNLGNVYGYNIECGDIHWKEFLNYSKCCEESRKSYVETDV